MPTCVRYNRDESGGGVATLTLDLADKSVNTLTRQMWADLDAALAQAEADRPAGLLVASAKPKTFVAGADLFELKAMTDAELDRYLADGQRILRRLEDLPFPTVALINGDALGGGLEVALACRHRVAAEDPSVKLGLPEVTLGLCPGWGGVVRSTRLLGPEKAIQLATTGKPVTPAEAKAMGLIDEAAPRENLRAVGQKFLSVGRAAVPPTAQALPPAPSQGTGKGREAADKILQIIRTTIEQGEQAGLDAERIGLVQLRASPSGRNLLRLFFLRQSAKKDAAKAAGGQPREVKKVGVVGGGMMGGGIVHALVKGKFAGVVCVEGNQDAAAAAADRLRSALSRENLPLDTHIVSTDLNDLKDCDLVIEAVFEDPKVKQELFAKLDAITRPGAILATNTSSLSVSMLAQTVNDPARVAGIHFFNPVPRMPLVEVVRHPCAAPDAVATAVAVATQLGKTPVVCNDAPGFIVNRVLMPYLSESMQLAEDGVAIPAIDAAVKRWGMPMGPFELLDQIGLDVIVGIFRALAPHLGDGVKIPAAVETALSRKWLGRKAKVGFYRYPDEKGAKPALHGELASMLGRGNVEADEESIQDRCLLPMANEAARVLEEKVTDSIDAIDLACITGLGMAGWRGGIVRYVLDEGVSSVASRLQQLGAEHGDRLNPSDHLWKMKEAAR